MTRGWLSVLALVEAILGLIGLLGAGFLLLAHSGGMTLLLLQALAASVLLLVAGAAIFVRRPWSYYTHIMAIILAGLLLMFSLGPMVGWDTTVTMVVVGGAAVALTVVFFLAPVRRYFGM